MFLRHLGAVLPGCLVAALVAGGGLIAGTAVAQHLTTSREPIVVHSVFSNINDATNTADFTDITVSQGDRRLTAERASVTGVGFTDSRWTFAGRVMITLEPRGSLWADQAILEFRGGELTQVTAIGSPAHFEQRRMDSRGVQRGQADQITYDAQSDTVRLSGQAELSDGRDVQITAPVFVYHIRDDRLQTDSGSEGRVVHMTVKP
jgi:lipopolysaccharide transport protein LptA